jgi:hypothetical protein
MEISMSGSTDAPRHTNRLIRETSPYLLQHAHNPVDWYPWGEEALARAKAEDTPILLSIGYSACHWCHVMERESFEDEAVAALMNRSFVNIKVDREERPDLDDIYMAATQAANGGPDCAPRASRFPIATGGSIGSGNGAARRPPYEPPGGGNQPLPAPARPQPRGLVSVGRGGLCAGASRR